MPPTIEPSGSAADIVTELGSIPSRSGRPSDPELWRVRDGLLNRLFGDPMPARLLGRYTLLRRIGTGGMGEVHLAEDPELDRRVAIKLLPAWEHEGRDVTRRLLHEARAIARLAHPNVVEVFDVGVHAGVPFVVMELVEGGTLADWLAERERSIAEIIAALLEAGAGLSAAHHAGVLHRDFKPANVLVGRDGRMRVADFGLAFEVPRTDSEPQDIDTEASTLELGGTPAFMAPEQHAALPLDERADVYAFCVTAHLACYGVLPFRGSLAAICAGKLAYDGSPPDDRTIDARLHDVIARGLHPDPRRRWSSIAAVCEALAASQRPRRLRAVAIGAITLLVLGGAALVGAREPEPCDPEAALAGVWDPTRRSELAARPVGSQQLLTAIDREADAWRTAFRSACERPPALRESAMACLGRSRRELEATLALFDEGDREVDVRAIDLIDGLASPTACVDAAKRTGEDSERAAILAELGAIEATAAAGRHAAADAALDELLVRAREHGDAATIAEVALVSARVRSELGDADTAYDRASEVLWTATALGDDRLAFEAAFELVWITGVDRSSPQVADDYAQAALASLARSGDEPRQRARLANQIGAVWGTARNFERARLELGRALTIAESIGDERIAMDVRYQLATIAMHEDHYDRAIPELRAALAWYERELGEQHPRVADTLGNLAQAELLSGDGKSARATIARAVELARTALGDRHPSTIHLLGVQGHVLTVLGDVPAALAVSREALAAMQAMYGADDHRLSAIETRLADLLGQQGELDEAIAHAEHALAINEQAYGTESSPTADAVHYLARIRGMKGERRADALFERAARLYATLGDLELEVTVLNDHVVALDQFDRKDEALVEAKRGWARAQQLPAGSMARASSGFSIAMLDEQRSLAERRTLALAARQNWLDAGVDPSMTAPIDAWLAAHPEPAAR